MQERNEDLQKEQTTDNTGADSKANNIHGRLDNTANPEFRDEESKADISQVDRQEGTMHHGELGGNFSNEKE